MFSGFVNKRTITSEQEAVEDWQFKRDNSRRGIVEVIHNDSEQSGT